MYLMNVPPVAATQTEWRRCGPPGGFSLPVCFNESDSELSTIGPPISDKVQMIIESLRSTQSSLEMGDEIEGNVLPRQEGHTQVYKVAGGSYVGVKAKTKSPSENLHPSSTNNQENSDSDSDDSVDRGIEEAILEYLKEKDDHKRKAEPCSTLLESSKVSRKHPSILEVSKQNSNSSTSLIGTSQFPISIKAVIPSSPATVPLKKYIKNKASLDENFNLNKSSAKTLISSKDQTMTPFKATELFNKTIPFPVAVKLEEESNDSSSDDGIEEAILRYQLEKKEQQVKIEAFTPHTFKEESDSTSDDGIEEAIRCYQLEQKEKTVPKPFLHKQKPFTKSAVNAVGGFESMKKQKATKKKGRTEKKKKSFQPQTSSVVIPETSLSDNPKGKGNGLPSLKLERFEEQQAPAPPKVNTTAELMCAEAILDISKTVMPAAFHHGIDLHPCAPTEPSVQPSVPESYQHEESDDSSIDSEDGIEQEIRNFLEQKAQMLKQPPITQDACRISEPENVKQREFAMQKKLQKLSLMERQKDKVKSGTDEKSKEAAPEPLRELTRESNPSEYSQRSLTHPSAVLHKMDKSGDKSSSLDSDEDLDTAIKDLLKTKKKSKKKIRDLKRKSRKFVRDEDPLLGNTLPSKKLKPNPISKFSALKKVQRSKDDMKDKFDLRKKSITQQKQNDQSQAQVRTSTLKSAEGGDAQMLHTLKTPPQTKDDSSSVDSDDSIEQEIRRFLAEKAKGSTMEKSKDVDASRNGAVTVGDADDKEESQLAEIPRKSASPLFGSLGRSVQDRTTHGPFSDVFPISAQSCMSSVQSCSPSLLEPADGVGAARTKQRRPIPGRDDVLTNSPQLEKVRPVLAPNSAHSRAESIKWRQSLGLPISDIRAHGRNPFHIKSSEITDTASTTSPYQSRELKLQTPASAWFTSKTSRAPFSGSSEADVNTLVRPPVLNFFPASRPPSKMSFTRSLAPGDRPQFSLEEEKVSIQSY
ncbi:protein phosphatase 1 regulatory subunit 26 isoform X2 [Cololabis saira]|uniref:protein phosphatase 1 regulatory subunit 26 isoform X2 n=1 Tax=Cololabis saira TaxID=129043 RepID=UPI002AD4494D|nr:protein phosphatase 1 regulatory subunit 26 isoform X2 [Cololabis saira]